MTANKLFQYLFFTMILFSAMNPYIAYGAGFLAFVLVLISDGKDLGNSILKNKIFLYTSAALLLSTVFSKVPLYSMQILLLLILHLMAYIVMVRYVRNNDVEVIFKLLNIMGIFICLYGIYQYVTGNLNINTSWTDKETYGNLIRIYSTLRNPNIFAAYLTVNLCFSMSYLLKKKRDIFIIINLALSSICLILTYSRGGFIAFAAAMLFITIISKEHRAGLYLTLMVLLNFGFNAYQNTDRGAYSKLATDSSSLYRIEIWKAAWNLFKSNVMTGAGLGSVPKILSYSSNTLKGYIFHAHNIPLQVLAETGLLGFTALIAAVVAGFKRFFELSRLHQYSEYAYIATGFAASLTAILIHGMVDCAVMIPSRSLLFLIYIALFPALYKKLMNIKVQ